VDFTAIFNMALFFDGFPQGGIDVFFDPKHMPETGQGKEDL